MRNIIGTLTLKSANSERGRINEELQRDVDAKRPRQWGIDIVRTELKESDPPKDVQETMNKVVKAENEKIAVVDFAPLRPKLWLTAPGARRSSKLNVSARPGSLRRTAKPLGDQAGQ